MSAVKSFNYTTSGSREVVAVLTGEEGLPSTHRLFVKNEGSKNFIAVGYANAHTLADTTSCRNVLKKFYKGDKVELQF